MTTVTIVLSDF